MKKLIKGKQNSDAPLNNYTIKKQLSSRFGQMSSRTTENLSATQGNLADIKYSGNHKQDHVKWNIYNSFFRKDKYKYILFNCSTNNLIYISRDLKEIISNNIENIHKLNSTHPQLYQYLKNQEFIVEKDFNEMNDAISRIQNNPDYSRFFELIINPTLNCNLKCWYCYESHIKNSFINDSTLKSIMCFIKRKVESVEIKEIMISFFGGEPLIEFNRAIWPIIEFTQKLCLENRKRLHICFITNAVLLTKEIVDKLYSNGLYCTFQVPFDGNEEYHNKTKKYANGKGTFNKVIDNVIYGLSKGNRFIIRCNYTSENIYSFDELISIFTKYTAECFKYDQLKFTYHKIWQEKETEELEDAVNKIKKSINLLDVTFDICYADRKNSMVINYNGDIYNCTARDFTFDKREGYLNTEGEIIYNKKYQERISARFSNENCQKCIIFPICNICSQTIIEHQNENIPCLRFISEKDKKNILLKKIKMKEKEINR